MSGDLAKFLSVYRGRELLLDANILLVLIVGSHDPLLIARHKRTRENYEPEDFALIIEIIELFHGPSLLTTPQVLTEVSNLLSHSGDPVARLLFARFVDVILHLEERYISSAQIAVHEQFATFGLTDIGILELATQNRALVITDDRRFADYLGRGGIDVLHFQDLRGLNAD